MAHVRFRRASSCLSKTSGGALACRSVSKLCLSNPPIRLNSAMVFKSVWAAILPPKKRRRMYSDRDNPMISAYSVRRVFSSATTRRERERERERESRMLAAYLPPSFVPFLPLMPFAFGMRETKRQAFRESRGRQPSGRIVVVYYNYHPATKNPPRAVVKL